MLIETKTTASLAKLGKRKTILLAVKDQYMKR